MIFDKLEEADDLVVRKAVDACLWKHLSILIEEGLCISLPRYLEVHDARILLFELNNVRSSNHAVCLRIIKSALNHLLWRFRLVLLPNA